MLKELVLKVLDGDIAATNEFVEKFSPAIKKEASKVYLYSYTFDDLFHIGVLSILESIRKIDLSRQNLNISAYIYTAIVNNYRYLIRKNISLNELLSINNTSDLGMEIFDSIQSNDDIEKEFQDKAMTNIIGQAIDELDSIERELIEYMYLSEEKNYAVGFMQMHSIPYYKFTQIKNSALGKILKYI